MVPISAKVFRAPSFEYRISDIVFRAQDIGHRISNVRFHDSDFGYPVRALKFGYSVQVRFRVPNKSIGFRIRNLVFISLVSVAGFRTTGLEYRFWIISGIVFPVQVFGYRVSGIELRVPGYE